MGFINGYQRINWLGQAVHIYQQKPNEKIGLMSAKQKGKDNLYAVQQIKDIDNDLTHYAKINCNYFDFDGTNEHYGVEQSFENDFAPKHKKWYCLYIDKANIPHYVLSSDYYLWGWQVTLAFSPKAILRHNGADCELLSEGANVNLAKSGTNTLLLYMGNGKYAFMVNEGKLTLFQCRDFAKTYGAVGIYALDGGGSSQMRANGKSIVYTGRAIPNVLTFYVGSLPEEEKEPETNDIGSADESKLEELEAENKKLSEENEKLKKKLVDIQKIINE